METHYWFYNNYSLIVSAVVVNWYSAACARTYYDNELVVHWQQIHFWVYYSDILSYFANYCHLALGGVWNADFFAFILTLEWFKNNISYITGTGDPVLKIHTLFLKLKLIHTNFCLVFHFFSVFIRLWTCESTIFTLSILEIQLQILIPYLFMRNHSIALKCLFFFCYRYCYGILDNVRLVLAVYIEERAIMHKY